MSNVKIDGVRRTLDRRPRTDTRNKPWRNRRTARRWRYWNTRTFFRQGEDPMCVAWAMLNRLACQPIGLRESDHVGARGLYHFAKEFDEWEGSDYDGTSALGVVKFLNHFEIFSAYYWPDSAAQVANAILTTAPVLIGTWLYEGMAWPTDGRMTTDGRALGGHEMLADGASLDDRGLRIKTWDETWGLGGHGWLSFEDFDALMADGGDAVVTIPSE